MAYDPDPICELISQTMAEQPEPVQIEYRLDCIVREIEALPPEKRIDAVIAGLDILVEQALQGKVDRHAVDQIVRRGNLIAGFALTPNGLRIVNNG